MFKLSNIKQLIKRWRRKRRRWLSLGAVVMLTTFIMLAAMSSFASSHIHAQVAGADANVMTRIGDAELALFAIFEKMAKKGDASGENLSGKNLSRENTNGEDAVDDNVNGGLSIGENSYIGLDERGVLSLFDGPPLRDKVIRSFFQIDIEFLESSLPAEIVAQLYNGIRVTNITQYNSVLSTFSDYAVDVLEQ